MSLRVFFVVETEVYADIEHDIQIETVIRVVKESSLLDLLKGGVVYSRNDSIAI